MKNVKSWREKKNIELGWLAESDENLWSKFKFLKYFYNATDMRNQFWKNERYFISFPTSEHEKYISMREKR